jgi:hypothetical protein
VNIYKFLLYFLCLGSLNIFATESIVSFDYYSERCLEIEEVLVECINTKTGEVTITDKSQVDKLDELKSKLFKQISNQDDLPLLVENVKLNYLQKLAIVVRKNKVLAHSFGKGQDFWKSHEQNALESCTDPKLKGTIANIFSKTSEKLGEFESIEAQNTARVHYKKRVHLALLELSRLKYLEDRYKFLFHERNIPFNEVRALEELEKLKKRRQKIQDTFPVLSYVREGRSLTQSIQIVTDRVIQTSSLDQVDFMRTSHQKSPTLDLILFGDNSTDSSNTYPFEDSLSRYAGFSERVLAQVYDKGADPLIDQMIDNNIETSINQTASMAKEICEMSPCDALRIDPYYVDKQLHKLTSATQRENLSKSLCYCSFRKQEKTLSDLQVLSTAGLGLGAGIACFMSAPVCLTAAALTGLSLRVSWSDYKDSQANKDTIEDLANYRSLGITDENLKAETLQEMNQIQNVAIIATLGLILETVPGLKNVTKSKNAAKVIMRAPIARDPNIESGGYDAASSYLRSSDEIDNFFTTDAYRAFDGGEKGVYQFADLRNNVSPNVDYKDMESMADEYWDYVGDIYKKDLNLTSTEVDSFIESSKEMSDRTLLIVNTKALREENRVFNGGVASVFSTKGSDKMPFEKATGLEISRGPPATKVAEIVRFTAQDKDNKGLSREMLNMLALSFARDKSLNKIYVFTSKKHMILYRRLRIPHRLLDESDFRVTGSNTWDQERDVIMEFTSDDFQQALLKNVQ